MSDLHTFDVKPHDNDNAIGSTLAQRSLSLTCYQNLDLIWLCLGHGIRRVAISINPFDLCDESLLVCLSEAHDVDHKFFLLRGA